MTKVFVADDDLAIVDSIKMILEEEGYEVYTEADGFVLEKMKEVRPDIVLLDLWMSGVNGSEICSAIKANPETKDIPVIIISANREGREISENACADDFLPKPFDIDDLLAKVEKFA